jgi:hypothetical protein
MATVYLVPHNSAAPVESTTYERLSTIKLIAEGLMSGVNGKATMRIDVHVLRQHSIASFAKRKKPLAGLQNTPRALLLWN